MTNPKCSVRDAGFRFQAKRYPGQASSLVRSATLSQRLRSAARRQLPYLAPTLAWMAVIAMLSTDVGSSSRTTDPVIRVVRRLLFRTRRLTPTELALLSAELELLSVVLRKSAHVFEYAVLTLLLCRWLRFSFAPSKLVLYSVAVAMAGCCASIDELHQLFVPSRTGSSVDVLIDVAGAVVGTVIFAYYRRAAEERGQRQLVAGTDS